MSNSNLKLYEAVNFFVISLVTGGFSGVRFRTTILNPFKLYHLSNKVSLFNLIHFKLPIHV